MKLSQHFDSKEFDCKCGCLSRPPKMPPDELINCLEEIRTNFNAPVIINSGYRCEEYNRFIGGAKSSRHVVGDAVDFVVRGVKTAEVYAFVLHKYGSKPYGIAIKRNKANSYAGFVHLDVRGKKARWEYA